jgi:ADP-heptose:LPS heptosyltransferase
VLHGGALGDCALALHWISVLRQAWHGAWVSLAARSRLARWAARNHLIDEALALDGLAGSIFGDESNSRIDPSSHRRLQDVDLIINFLSGQGEAVALRLEALVPGRIVSIDPRPSNTTVQFPRHILLQWTESFNTALVPKVADRIRGIPLQCMTSLLNVNTPWPLGHREWPSFQSPNNGSKMKRTHSADRQARENRPLTFCHPGSGGLTKCCPLEAWESLVGKLVHRGKHVAWMIGPDERERFGTSLEASLKKSAPVFFEESVDAAADLVAQAEAFVGHDAGMTHVAALTGVPTIAVFGPTDPAIWRPIGRRVEIVPFPESGFDYDAWSAGIARRLDALHSPESIF